MVDDDDAISHLTFRICNSNRRKFSENDMASLQVLTSSLLILRRCSCILCIILEVKHLYCGLTLNYTFHLLIDINDPAMPNFLFWQRSRGWSDTRSIHICIERFEFSEIAYNMDYGKQGTGNGANVQHKTLNDIILGRGNFMDLFMEL